MLFFLIITSLKIHSIVKRPQILEDYFTDHGNCGQSATYSYAQGVLTFEGQGEINDEAIDGGPWKDYSSLITSIVINEGITSIQNQLFKGFIHLKTISIPASLIDYTGDIVTLCEELESYIISEDNLNLAVDEGVLYSKDFTILISVPSKLSSTYTFKDSVTTIKKKAFQSNKMTTLNIPNTITSIEDCAFQCSNELKSLTLSDSVISLGTSVFSDCHALETVNLGEGITSLPRNTFSNCTKLTTVRLNNNLEIIEDYAFSECSSLASIELPNGLTKIGISSFYFCSSLDSINLVSSLTSIGLKAFYHCKLSSIYIPSKIADIEEYTFCFCPITSLTIPGTVQKVGKLAFSYCDLLQSVTFEEGVETIAEEAFYNCSSLTKVTISSTVSSIDKRSFNDCYSLESFNISKKNQNYASFSGALYVKDLHEIIRCPNGLPRLFSINDNTTSIGDEAFSNCIYLRFIILPDGLKTIGKRSFENCIDLMDIRLQYGITSIGENAFAFCKRVETLNMPNSIEQIGNNCFSSCNIHYLQLSDHLKEIPFEAFYGNPLQSVIVPDNIEILRENSLYSSECNQVVLGKTVTLIEKNAFHAKNLYITGTQQPEISSLYDIENAFILVTPEYEGDTFAGMPVSKTLRYGNYGSQYWLIDTKTGVFDYIGDGYMLDFYYETSDVLWYSVFDLIKKVNIINPIKSVGMKSFNSCPNLETVTFNSELTEIHYLAFFNCSKLSGDIVIPENVGSIRDSAFAGTNLETVTYLGSIQPICDDPFTADGIKQPPLLKIHVPSAYDDKTFCGIRADGLETEDYTDNTPISLPFPTPSPLTEVNERFECTDDEPESFYEQLIHPFNKSDNQDYIHVVSVVNKKIYFDMALEDNQFIKPVGKSIIDFQKGGKLNIVLPKNGGTTILLGDEDSNNKISLKGSGEVTIKHEKEKSSTFNITRLLINGTIKIHVPDYIETIYIDHIQYEANSVFNVVKENAKSVKLVVKNVISFYMSNGELSDITVLDTISLYQTGSLKINNVNLEKAKLLFYIFDYGNESFNNPFIKGNFDNPPSSIKIIQNVTSDEENPDIDEYYRIASGIFDENKCEEWIQKIDFGKSSFNEKACLDNETLLDQQNEHIAIKAIPKEKSKNGLSGGAIAGIVIGCIAGVALIVGAVFLVLYLKKKTKIGNDSP